MKKRAAEAAVILAAVIIILAVINAVSSGLTDSVRRIDGEYYSTGERELDLVLMTTDGTEQLGDFARLERLKVSPYREEVKAAVRTDNAEAAAVIKKEADELYAGCTSLEDISFVCLAENLEELDISLCKTSDISCLEGMKLRKLDISYTNVDDLSPIARMEEIEELIMADIPAEDLSPLLESRSLKRLVAEEGRDIPDGLSERGIEIEYLS